MATTDYAQYLALDRILNAQNVKSDVHDELLFIIIHQTKELWLKQIIAELLFAKQMVQSDMPNGAYKNLARVSRIQTVMSASWDVLSTMTPADYSGFRDGLGTSSGFQSAQFRRMEFLLGLKENSHLSNHSAEDSAILKEALEGPSLWDDANAALVRAGLLAEGEMAVQQRTEVHIPDIAVEEAWLKVYRDTEKWWDLYQLAEKLVDIDDSLASWRHKHALTVERIIGAKRGTGGSAGVSYLLGTVRKRCFPELWSLRTKM